MKATDPRHILAASYRRLAAVLRIRAAAYNRIATAERKRKNVAAYDYWRLRSQTALDLANELGNEARTLRAEGK